MSEEHLDEKIIKKVDSKGNIRKRKKCKKGFRLKGGTCVPMTGTEKLGRKKASKKAVLTKRAKGSGAKARSNKKRIKAMKKRKSFGFNK